MLDATDGHGVDVVLDVLGGGGLAENLAMLADDGRLVVIGLQQGRRGELDLSVLLAKRASVLGTMLRSPPARAEGRDHGRRPSARRGRSSRTVPCTRSCTPASPFDQAADAHRLLESGEAFGKVLLIP